MKGYYDEFGTAKNIAIFIVLVMGFIGITQVTGHLTITVTGQPTIDILNYELSTCQSELETKCDPCPIVKCSGDMTFVGFIVGMFFGSLFGIWFTINFGKQFKKEFQKQIDKLKSQKESKGGL